MANYWAWVVFERRFHDGPEARALVDALYDGSRRAGVDLNPLQPLLALNAYGDTFGRVEDPDVVADGPTGMLALGIKGESWRHVDRFLRKAATRALPDNPIRHVVIRRLWAAPAGPIVPPV
jgi:hypothetical protein